MTIVTVMTYILTMVIVTAVPLAMGMKLGKPLAKWCHAHQTSSGVIVIMCALAWFGIARWARVYADGDGIGWSVAEWFAHYGKWYVFSAAVFYLLGVAARTDHLTRGRKVALVVSNLAVIWLLVWRTMPSYVWLPENTERDERGYMRQSIEYTCGPIALGNLLEREFGRPSPTERDLARLAGTTVEGTRMHGLIRAADALGLELVTCRLMGLDELKELNVPAIVQISTIPTVRHATLLVGIHGDSVTFIDPAYGYHQITAERFVEIWYGKTAIFRDKKANATTDAYR